MPERSSCRTNPIIRARPSRMSSDSSATRSLSFVLRLSFFRRSARDQTDVSIKTFIYALPCARACSHSQARNQFSRTGKGFLVACDVRCTPVVQPSRFLVLSGVGPLSGPLPTDGRQLQDWLALCPPMCGILHIGGHSFNYMPWPTGVRCDRELSGMCTIVRHTALPPHS